MFDTIPYQVYESPAGIDSLTIADPVLPVELLKIPLSHTPDTLGAFFIIFSVLFLCTAPIVGSNWKMVMAMLDSLWHSKGRQSIFYVITSNEQRSKYVLFVQGLILCSIFIYKFWIIHLFPAIPTTLQTLTVIGELTVFLLLFYCFKWLAYSFVGIVFFPVDRLQQWRTSFFSMICISGIILFVPVLLFIFVESLALFSYYFVLFYFLLFGLVVIYKTYELFFPQRDTLLYLFLYLCGQEIVFLFFFYKLVAHFFNIFL